MDHTVTFNWQEHVKYGSAGPEPQILADDDKIRLIVGGLQAGARIPIHAEEKAVYHFLEGTGQMFVDDQTIPVTAGVTVAVPQGARRGMLAETRLAFLAVRVV